MTVERIVRPFQIGDVFNARVLPPEQPAVIETPDEAHIEWKGSADSHYTEAPPPATLGFAAEWKEDASQRKTDTVRIKNADDPDQFVDVERIKQMVLKNNKTGETIKIQPLPVG